MRKQTGLALFVAFLLSLASAPASAWFGRIQLTASGGKSAVVVVNGGSWRPEKESDFNTPGGTASFLTPGQLTLDAEGGISLSFVGFKTSSQAGATGEGTAYNTDGTFGDGSFNWECVH